MHFEYGRFSRTIALPFYVAWDKWYDGKNNWWYIFFAIGPFYIEVSNNYDD
jgi:hypothetical protein